MPLFFICISQIGIETSMVRFTYSTVNCFGGCSMMWTWSGVEDWLFWSCTILTWFWLGLKSAEKLCYSPQGGSTLRTLFNRLLGRFAWTNHIYFQITQPSSSTVPLHLCTNRILNIEYWILLLQEAVKATDLPAAGQRGRWCWSDQGKTSLSYFLNRFFPVCCTKVILINALLLFKIPERFCYYHGYGSGCALFFEAESKSALEWKAISGSAFISKFMSFRGVEGHGRWQCRRRGLKLSPGGSVDHCLKFALLYCGAESGSL